MCCGCVPCRQRHLSVFGQPLASGELTCILPPSPTRMLDLVFLGCMFLQPLLCNIVEGLCQPFHASPVLGW